MLREAKALQYILQGKDQLPTIEILQVRERDLARTIKLLCQIFEHVESGLYSQ